MSLNSCPNRWISTAAALALALGLCVAPTAAQPAAPEAEALRVESYSIELLADFPQDQPLPPLGFDPPAAAAPKRELAPLSGLVDEIRASIDPAAWREPGVRLELDGNRLVVAARPPVPQRVGELLTRLERSRSRQIRLELLRYRSERAALQAVLAQGPVLGPPGKLLREPGRSAGGLFCVERHEMLGFSGQRVVASEVTRRSYVRGAKVEVATGTREYAVQPADLHLGWALGLRAVLASNAREALVEMHLRSARLVANPTFTIGPREIPALSQPEVEQVEIGTTCWVPLGQLVFVAAWPGEGSELEWCALCAELADPEASPPPVVDFAGQRFLDLFDLRYLLRSPVPRTAPWLGSSPAAPSPIAFDKPFAGPSTAFQQALLHQIKGQVAEDSWHNARNHLFFVGEQLAAIQRQAELAAVGTLLSGLERSRNAPMLFELDLVEPADGTTPMPRAGESLPDEAFAALLPHLRASWLVSGLAGERIAMARVSERPIVAEFSLEVAQGVPGLAPVVRNLRQGQTLELQARLVGERTVLGQLAYERVELSVEDRELREAFEDSTRMAVGTPWPTTITRSEQRAAIRMQLASISRQAVPLELVVPLGQRRAIRSLRSGTRQSALFWRLDRIAALR